MYLKRVEKGVAARRFPGLAPGIRLPLCLPLYLALFLAFAATSPASAQQQFTAVGFVTDQQTGKPLANAIVQVIGDQGIPVVSTRSGVDGRYVLTFPITGIVRIRASALGYMSVVRSMRWPNDTDIQDVPFPLDPRPIEIDPLSVEADRRGLTPGRELFAERREEGKGTFITQADILAWQPRWLPELLLNIDGIWIWPGDGGSISSRVGRGKCLHVLVDGWTVQAQGSRFLGIEAGITRPTAMYDDWRLDIDPYRVGGIEVYPAYEDVPEELQMDAYPCGLVVIWNMPAWVGPKSGGR